MAVKAPKNLDVPTLVNVTDLPGLIEWIRRFADDLAFHLRQIRSDTVEVSSGEWFYLGDGTEGTDGSWRLGLDGTYAVLQCRISGTWVTEHKWEPDA